MNDNTLAPKEAESKESGQKPKKKPLWRKAIERKFITSFLMGFTSGAPLLVTSTLVQRMLAEAQVDIKAIGALALVGLPYSLKFLWAPGLDFYDPPFLKALGRRRGWLLLAQIALIISMFAMSLVSANYLAAVALVTLFISFASATQDILVDAYRRDDLSDRELGVGSAYYVWGYRLGMLAISGGGLIVAEYVGWANTFRLSALLLLVGPLTLIFSPEPQVERPGRPASLKETILEPLRDFWSRSSPVLILLFIFFYKFGDQLATALTTAFYTDLGYTKAQIGAVVKIFGAFPVLLGVMIGGWCVLRWGQRLSLWLFGFYQMITILGFVLLTYLPVHHLSLAFVISQENLAAGLGTSAFVAFMASQTNRSFSATQYALLSALMALPRTLLSAPAGFLVESMGWEGFFYFSTATALPAFLILYLLGKRGIFTDAPPKE